MYRTLGDIEGRYVVVPPEEGVSLADIHNVPYPAPDYAVLEDGSRISRIVVRPWSDKYPGTPANTGGFSAVDMRPLTPMPAASPEVTPPAGISFADLVRTLSSAADPGAWRDDNRAAFWIPDNLRALSGPSFDDLVRTIDPRANPDIWRDDNSAPPYAAWEDSDRYSVPYDPRAAALGAFRIPGVPEDAAQWRLRESAPTGAEGIPPVQLADWRGLAALRLIWNRVRGGRIPAESRAPAPSGRKGEPLQTPKGPPRNPPGEVINRPYSGHALDKMQDQRLPPSVIENAVRRGAPRLGKTPGTTRYFDEKNNLSVVVDNKTGRVITNHYGDR